MFIIHSTRPLGCSLLTDSAVLVSSRPRCPCNMLGQKGLAGNQETSINARGALSVVAVGVVGDVRGKKLNTMSATN